ncbi:MAG: LacI family DNA-binding transcriptional regulator [Candidatus Omnitrophica bacterium]|nr:LacI family DNA-binding transcriptional regulator [Candidatus Omnitrophota bacterium]
MGQGRALMKLNIKEMAKKAGVSVATISRAINAQTRGKVAPDTLEKVDALIKKHGYTPNLSAKHLRQSSTRTIGVIFPYFRGIFHHSYYVEVLAGISDYLLGTDYQFKMLLLKEDKEQWDQYDFKRGERVDGLIITHWPRFFSHKSVLEQINIPSVIISDLRKDVKNFFVGGDQVSGGRQAAEHLYGLGHRRMAVLTGPAISMDSRLRLRGFEHYLGMKGLSLDPQWIVGADFLEDAAYNRVEKVLKDRKRPTAIFCLNDQMAFGTLRKLSDLKIACPEEISVVGYDDDPRGLLSVPALTTVRVPLYELAQEGTRRLINHLKSPSAEKPLHGHVVFPVQLVQRKSTACQ